jgi:hypothetical protein
MDEHALSVSKIQNARVLQREIGFSNQVPADTDLLFYIPNRRQRITGTELAKQESHLDLLLDLSLSRKRAVIVDVEVHSSLLAWRGISYPTQAVSGTKHILPQPVSLQRI